ncbi:MAG: hypothetical protein ACI9FB_002460 [Candidatus Azotimanducaceae bacterium]|jgi:hypothetical protein
MLEMIRANSLAICQTITNLYRVKVFYWSKIVFFIFGEKVHSESREIGHHFCGVCSRERLFHKIVETNYFSLFTIRLLPMEKIAHYSQCEHCNNAFSEGQTGVPTQIKPIKKVISYIQLGYGMQKHRALSQDICIKVSSFEYMDEEISAENRTIMALDFDIYSYLKSIASNLNMRGKQEIIEAAFLVTHACCEIQYEDRLRINLMGNALGVSLEFINSIIDHLHAQACYGVRRVVPTRVQTS